MTITSGKDVTLNNDTATDLGASTVSGKLNVTASVARLRTAGTAGVAGTTTLAAGAANNITLDNADHLVGTVIVTSGKDVTLNQ